MPRRTLTIARESWPIAGRFTISRGSKTHADVVTVTLRENGATGRGECVPYARYGETVEATVAALETARETIEAGIARSGVTAAVPLRAAQNALDCALWDLEAKLTGTPVWQRAGLKRPEPLTTAYTLSLDTPERMAEMAAKAVAGGRTLLKLKLGQTGDTERLSAIRKAAPDARLIIDANEGWQPDMLADMFARCADAGVELIEQPLPASSDAMLADIARPVPVCADESAHDSATVPALVGKYDAINIKTDKTGGLSEALRTRQAAEAANMRIMTGCMLATSLAMAPAMLVAANAAVVDLDGPLLLAEDRVPGLRYEGGTIHPAPPDLWG